MKAVHQLVHTLSYGDAISGEVLALQRALQGLGFESEVYSINTHPKLKGRAIDYREFPQGFSGEVVLHYSIGSPLNDLYRALGSATRGMIFHNLTPESWFKGINPRIVRDIEAGRRELPELCKITDRLIADSQFNASELKELGFDAQVLELPIDPKRWEMPANPGISSLVQSQQGIDILHVGRLAPNKCVEDIIKAFYFVHNHITGQHSRLWLVGIDIDTELYSFELKRLARELHVDQAVNFAGCLADSEIKALYQNCSVYMCMSEHEGFCVPLIEAMHFGLPVIAYGATAVPDTVGDGGIVVNHKRHAELAELAVEVATNTGLRDKLVRAGKQRVDSLSYDHFQQAVESIWETGETQSTAAAASAMA